MNDKILKKYALTGWILITKGILVVVLIYAGLEFSQNDEVLPKSDINIPQQKNVNQENSILLDDFENSLVALDLSICIMPSVNRIRSKNVRFERNGVIPGSERLAFCYIDRGVHICVDNRYPVIFQGNGSIDIQKTI
jgi:hypothetical protein